jgi:hypothetical protein
VTVNNVSNSNSSGFDPISSAIHQAASITGVDFSFLFKQAKIESGLNTDAKAGTSSASGLFQFTKGTWLKVVADHGAAAGLPSEAAALSRGSVSPAYEKQILDLRNNADISAQMAVHYAVDNAKALKAQGINVTGPTDLYLAHFLGSGGAAKFLNGLKNNPDGPAANALPDAAGANKSIFYANGKSKSFSDIYQHFAKSFDGDRAPTPQSVKVAQAVLANHATNTIEPQISKIVVNLPKSAEPQTLFKQTLEKNGFDQLKIRLPTPEQAKTVLNIQRAPMPSAPPPVSEAQSTAPNGEKPPVALDKLAKFLDGASKWYVTPDQAPAHEQKLLVHQTAPEQANAGNDPSRATAG